MVHGAHCINLNSENYVRKSVLNFTVYLFVYSYTVQIYILFFANFEPNEFKRAPSHRANGRAKGGVSSSPLPPLTVELWCSLKIIKHAFPWKLSRVILSNCVLKYMPLSSSQFPESWNSSINWYGFSYNIPRTNKILHNIKLTIYLTLKTIVCMFGVSYTNRMKEMVVVPT